MSFPPLPNDSEIDLLAKILIRLNELSGGSPIPPIPTPPDVPNLSVWFAADAGMAFSDNGITPCVNDDPVYLWKNQQSIYDLTQPGAGNRPIYKTGILNGKPVIRFDGVNDFMDTAIFGAALIEPNTVFVVANVRNAANMAVFDTVSTPGARELFGREVSASNSKMEITDPISVAALGYVDTVPTGFNYWSLFFNGASSSISRNGVLKDFGLLGSDGLSSLRMGSVTNAPAAFADMDIAEFIVYNAALTAMQQGTVEAYLAAKYGL